MKPYETDIISKIKAAMCGLEPSPSLSLEALESTACSNTLCPIRDKCALGTRDTFKVWTWEKFQGWGMVSPAGEFWVCPEFLPVDSSLNP